MTGNGNLRRGHIRALHNADQEVRIQDSESKEYVQ